MYRVRRDSRLGAFASILLIRRFSDHCKRRPESHPSVYLSADFPHGKRADMQFSVRWLLLLAMLLAVATLTHGKCCCALSFEQEVSADGLLSLGSTANDGEAGVPEEEEVSVRSLESTYSPQLRRMADGSSATSTPTTTTATPTTTTATPTTTTATPTTTTATPTTTTATPTTTTATPTTTTATPSSTSSSTSGACTHALLPSLPFHAA